MHTNTHIITRSTYIHTHLKKVLSTCFETLIHHTAAREMGHGFLRSVRNKVRINSLRKHLCMYVCMYVSK